MSAVQKKIMFQVVQALGKKYAFDTEEAYTYVDGVVFNAKPANAGAGKEEDARAGKEEEHSESTGDETATVSTESKLTAIEKTRKNIALWTTKYDKLVETIKSGKSKDENKDKTARDKLAEKLTAEKEKLKKQEAKEAKAAAPNEEKKTKPAPAKAEKKKDTDEKRIKRMSPTLATQLKKCLDESKIDHSDAKVFDKIKKDFVKYIDDLTETDFTGKSLPDHMRDFAGLKGETHEEPKTASHEETTSAAPVVLELSDLQKIESNGTLINLPGDSHTNGVYYDSKKGQIVTGPNEVEGEDFEEITFNGNMYVIGETTGRVYEPTDGSDKFVGFLGIGKFKTMTR